MRLGRHMPLNAKPLKAVETARDMGCNTIQIFASNPTGWRPAADNPASCAAFAQAALNAGLDPVVIHAPYLINLASPEDENLGQIDSFAALDVAARRSAGSNVCCVSYGESPRFGG